MTTGNCRREARKEECKRKHFENRNSFHRFLPVFISWSRDGWCLSMVKRPPRSLEKIGEYREIGGIGKESIPQSWSTVSLTGRRFASKTPRLPLRRPVFFVVIRLVDPRNIPNNSPLQSNLTRSNDLTYFRRPTFSSFYRSIRINSFYRSDQRIFLVTADPLTYYRAPVHARTVAVRSAKENRARIGIRSACVTLDAVYRSTLYPSLLLGYFFRLSSTPPLSWPRSTNHYAAGRTMK